MSSYYSTTPLDWSGCTKCPLHSTRRHVVTRRSGLILPNRRIVHLTIDCPLTPDHFTHYNNLYEKDPPYTSLLPRLNPPGPPVPIPITTCSNPPHILIIGQAPGKLEDDLGIPFWGRSGYILDLLLLTYNTEPFWFTMTNMVCCKPPNHRNPLPEEVVACSDHITQLIRYANHPITGIIRLGELATTDSDLPQLNLTHPAAIARMPYKHLTLRRQSNALISWIKTL